MEEDFPRGGRAPAKTEASKEQEQKPHYKKKRALEPKDDFLFGTQKKDKRKKKSKRTTDEEDDIAAQSVSKHSLLPLGGGGVVFKKNPNKAAITGKKNASEPFIEALGFSRLAKGTKLLGIVREVQEEFALVSLPNLLTGYVLRTECGSNAPPLSHAVSVGQVLAVVILRTITENTKSAPGKRNNNTRRRIQVSLEPSAFNLRHEEPTPKFPIRGKVQGIEDNGLLVDLGHGRKGFLKYEDMDENTYAVKDNEEESDESEDEEDGKVILQVGRLEDFIVKKGAKNGIVPLKLPSPDRMAKHSVPSDTMPSIQSISPGWLVKVKVESIARNGLCVAFMGNVFRGSVELAHLGGFWIPTTRQTDGSTDWKGLFRDAPNPIVSFTARILAVDVPTKMIRLTALPHLMDLCPPPTSFLPSTGEVIEDATVVRLDAGVGALLALPSPETAAMEVDKDSDDEDEEADVEDSGYTSLLHKPLTDKEAYKQATRVRAVYVHISKAMDEKEDGKTSEAAFAKEFAPSSKHTVRILSTSNLIENVASGAAAESIIKAHVLTHADLKPGKIFRQVPVCAHLDGGAVLVEFGMEVRGLLTAHHLFDQAGTSEFRTKMLKAKYAIGAKVDVRVLSSDPTSKRCFLTAKKALLQASDTITSYESCKVGSTAWGFVSRVDDRGLFVTFFNKVYGRVTARSLALELGIDNHRENYKIGDAVQCRVANIKKVRRESHGRRHIVYESDEEDDGSDDESRYRYTWELTLSLRRNASDNNKDDTGEENEKTQSRVHLRAGAVLPEKAMKVVSLVPGKQKENRFVPGYAIVKIKSNLLVDEAESATMLPYVECKLSYDSLQDNYASEDRESAASMDALAERLLTPGKSLKQKGILLSDPRKSSYEYSAGMGRLTLISIRPKLVEMAEAKLTSETDEPDKVMLPAPDSNIFEGAQVLGFVTHIDHRFGAFVRFLDGLTGLVPKTHFGLDLEPFSTVIARVVSVDHMSRPPKILLSVPPSGKSKADKATSPGVAKREKSIFSPGDVVRKAEIESVDFYNANLKILDKEWQEHAICARIHCTMAASDKFRMGKTIKEKHSQPSSVTKFHPFSGWSVGKQLENLRVVHARTTDGISYVEFTNQANTNNAESELPKFVTQANQTPVGSQITGIVKQIAFHNGGICLSLGPKFTGFIPGVECSEDPEVLNNLPKRFPVGARLECTVIDQVRWHRRKEQATGVHKSQDAKTDGDTKTVYLSMLSGQSAEEQSQKKPVRGDIVVGRIQRSLKQVNSPALMLELRGGYVGRCCITELEEMDEWVNMPLGHTPVGKSNKEAAIVSGGSDEEDVETSRPSTTSKKRLSSQAGAFQDGVYVTCRVLSGIPSRPLVDVSLRSSRVEGDLEDDEAPEAGEMTHAYVVNTNKRGCFIRLNRNVDGRVALKELSDEFLPNPAALFPPGRLVVGKVKEISIVKNKKQTKTLVDLDMRETTALESQQLQFDDVELQSKFKATVTRVENYGVFVRLENSRVSGLVHKSECSDNYIKNIFDLYDPGDLVKVLVIKKDEEQKRLGFSMKASHFADDEDSDDDSISEAMSEDEEDNAEMLDVVEGADDLDSEDEDFGSKLAKAMSSNTMSTEDLGSDDESSGSKSGDESSDDSDSDSDGDDGSDAKIDKKPGFDAMDTDVGFDWNARAAELTKKEPVHDSDSESDGEGTDEEENIQASSTSHKSRKKQAQKRREEQEILRRETALADGTADENPETTADFERLLSGSPNSSEIWIRYMAFHLSLADIASARAVAERAFSRIEFREEREKLNVWCALLQLELKYGNASSLQTSIDRACQQNNPKQVYLRVCEMLENEVNASSPDTVVRADAMFAKMCKKFKSKKKVWIAHLQYLLRSGRHKEAHDLLRKSLKSLPEYKHVETMSKFAQLEFEFGSPERARTVFDGIILKHPKRLDLVFVYADKEVKLGSVSMARALFERVAHPRGDAPKAKLSDKQMKSLFKKWYRMEEEHGTTETQEHVKDAAKSYVQRASG